MWAKWRDGARAAALAVLLAGCAVTPNAEDPFAAGGDAGVSRPGERPYRVRLEVVCNYCAITDSVAGRIQSAGATTPVWRQTFDRYPRFPEAIRLTASGDVDRIRIYVNGDLAAFEESNVGDAHVVLQAETVIPTPTDAPVPDSSSTETAHPTATARARALSRPRSALRAAPRHPRSR